MLFAGAVHPHGSIVRPIIIHTVCICQFIPSHFSPNLHPMGCFPPPAAPCKPQNPGRRPPAAQRRANGLRPCRRLRRRACGPPPPPPGPPPPPPPPPRAGHPRPARAGGPAAGPAPRTPRKLFPHKLPPTGKNTRQGRPHRVMLSRYSVISPAPARICGSPPLSSRRAPGRYASRFRGNCW